MWKWEIVARSSVIICSCVMSIPKSYDLDDIGVVVCNLCNRGVIYIDLNFFVILVHFVVCICVWFG